MAVGMGMMGAVDGNLGAQGQPFSPSRGFPSTQGSGTATTTLLGHLGPSLGEPGGSDGILWEIFFTRMTSPQKRWSVPARINQLFVLSQRMHLCFCNFSKAFFWVCATSSAGSRGFLYQLMGDIPVLSWLSLSEDGYPKQPKDTWNRRFAAKAPGASSTRPIRTTQVVW